MKKILTTIFALLLALAGCNDSNVQPSSTSSASVSSVIEASDIRYDPTNIKVQRIDTPSESEIEFDLNSDEIETIVLIWNDSNWEAQITKTAYDYLFEFSGNSIRYVSEFGLFNDPVNNRHLYVTEEQRVLINTFLD